MRNRRLLARRPWRGRWHRLRPHRTVPKLELDLVRLARDLFLGLGGPGVGGEVIGRIDDPTVGVDDGAGVQLLFLFAVARGFADAFRGVVLWAEGVDALGVFEVGVELVVGVGGKRDAGETGVGGAVWLGAYRLAHRCVRVRADGSGLDERDGSAMFSCCMLVTVPGVGLAVPRRS